MKRWVLALMLALSACGAPEAAVPLTTEPITTAAFCRLSENTLPTSMLLGPYAGGENHTDREVLIADSNRFSWYAADYERCFDDAARDALMMDTSPQEATEIARRTCSTQMSQLEFYRSSTNRLAAAIHEPNWAEESQYMDRSIEALESLGIERATDLFLCREHQQLSEG